jgi:hypothetical protein
MYDNKTYITMQDLMEQMDISDKTLHRMIDDGDLPDFTYGCRTSRKKGWHTAVLERHAMEKYEQSASYKNVSNAGKVVTQDMSIVSLGRTNRAVAHQDGNLDDRNTSKKKLSGKKVSKSMRPSTSKSRVSTGFTYPNA